MPREFSLIMPAIASPPAGVPIAQLATPAGTGIRVLRIELGTDTAGATSTQVTVTGQRRSTASTLPNAATLVALSENDPASLLSATTTTNAYGIATVTGTAGAVLHRWSYNCLNGLIFTPSFDEQIFIKPSSFWTLQFVNASTLTWSAHIIIQEVD